MKGSTITGHTLNALHKHQTLTLVLPLPEGYWVDTVKHEKEVEWLFKILGYPLYTICISLLILLWHKYRKDRKLFPSVQFEDPEGLNVAEISYIVDSEVDNKDVTSLILYWAEQGLLEIEKNNEDPFSGKILILTKIQKTMNTVSLTNCLI